MPSQDIWLTRWQQLDAWLHPHRDYWQPQPFQQTPNWTQQQPQLNAWLLQLSDHDWQHYEHQPEALLEPLSQWLPALADWPALTQLPDLSQGDASLPESQAPGMPGRKRLQAGAFTAALLPVEAGLFDWCCGSGHLARTLAPHTPGAILGLEWNPDLVHKGNQLAQKAGVAVSIRQQDVLQGKLCWPLQPQGVALHACGDLHRTLIRQAIQQQLPRLSLSPCCYHLGSTALWQPLSQTASNSLIRGLSRADLRLAVQETATAPQRVTTQRRQLNAWRLGFDRLQQQLTGPGYQPLPSCSPTQLQDGFTAFCHWAAQQQRIHLPENLDFDDWEQQGQQCLQQVERQELLRHLFRRPLEIWLALDYVLALQEASYQVRFGTFCQRQLTPRNLLLDARKQDPKQACTILQNITD